LPRAGVGITHKHNSHGTKRDGESLGDRIRLPTPATPTEIWQPTAGKRRGLCHGEGTRRRLTVLFSAWGRWAAQMVPF